MKIAQLKNSLISPVNWLGAVAALSFLLLLVVTFIFGPVYFIDTPAYIQAAHYYAQFDFMKAINGYWSPLYSLLMAPFMFLPVEPIWIARGINMCAAVLVLFLLARRFRAAIRAEKTHFLCWSIVLLYAAISILIIIWSVSWLTPDFLSAVLALLAAVLAQRLISQPTMKRGLLLGAVLAGVFLAKAIGLLFAAILMGVLIVRTIYAWRRPGGRLMAKPVGVAAALFGAVVLVWSLLLFAKYDTFTFSTASQYNVNLAGPKYIYAHQISTPDIFLEPPYSSGSSVWDDPSYLHVEGWSIFEDSDHFFTILKRNATGIWTLSLAVPVVLFAAYVLVRRKKGYHRAAIIAPAVAVLAAYLPTLVEERYLYMVWIPLVVMAGVAVIPAKRLLYGYTLVALLSASLAMGGVVAQKPKIAREWHVYSALREAQGVVPERAIVAVRGINMMYHCVALNVKCIAVNYSIEHQEDGLEALRERGVAYYLSDMEVMGSALYVAREYLEWSGPLPSPSLYIYKL